MNDLVNEVTQGLPDVHGAVAVTWRLLLSALVGGVLGLERSLTGKQAGLRTHMLVSLGSAVFVMAALQKGASMEHLTRVIQGIATGIGFVGAGAILKLQDREKVKGLTTAANIWLTAALGTSVGAGEYFLPIVGGMLAWIILTLVDRLERAVELKRAHPNKPQRDYVD